MVFLSGTITPQNPTGSRHRPLSSEKRTGSYQGSELCTLFHDSGCMLAHTLFPLGTYTKAEIRQIAQEQGFINADKPDSQDICFVPDGDYASFIEEYTQPPYPEILSTKKGKFWEPIKDTSITQLVREEVWAFLHRNLFTSAQNP